MQQFSCPACHKIIAYKPIKTAMDTGSTMCPQCGHPFYIVSCSYCCKPVELKEAVRINGEESSADYHKSCYAFIQKEQDSGNQSHRTESQTESQREWTIVFIILLIIIAIVIWKYGI